MRLTQTPKIFRVELPAQDMGGLLLSPAFRGLLAQHGHLLKINLTKAPFCIFLRSELMPVVQVLTPDNRAVARLQSSLVGRVHS